MVLFDIPDIRLFWSTDRRFLDQFDEGKDQGTMKFKPFSKFPMCYKDMSFWLPDGQGEGGGRDFHPNDIYELIRDIAGDIVEKVELFDEFKHPKTGKQYIHTVCFRMCVYMCVCMCMCANIYVLLSTFMYMYCMRMAYASILLSWIIYA
ncbi:hypothetical protein EON63_24250 [archaeon]|nr:MAG: hypothetical protein EON63_24250 [archaeon]